jgi:L-histidine N-alpha-methyltransferase
LESTRDQQVYIAGAELRIQIAALETIHTENSYKFTSDTLRTLLDAAGFTAKHTWTDPSQWYAVTLAGVR